MDKNHGILKETKLSNLILTNKIGSTETFAHVHYQHVCKNYDVFSTVSFIKILSKDASVIYRYILKQAT